jgi:hypothetical protein
LFGKRVVLCEGATEVGVVRAIGEHARKTKGLPFSVSGTIIVDGEGSTFIEYAKKLTSLGIPVLVLCDSDREDHNKKICELESNHICVLKWMDNDALEQAVFRNVTNNDISKLICLYDDLRNNQTEHAFQPSLSRGTIQCIKSVIPSFDPSGLECNHEWTDEERKKIGDLAKSSEWFKRISKGERLGQLLEDILPTLPEDNILRHHFAEIERWGCDA